MRRSSLPVLALVACPLLAAAQPAAAPTLAQLIDQRQSRMGRSGRELHELEQALAGGAALATIAPTVQRLVTWSDELPSLFPAGSHSEEGDTRLTIWSNPAGFAAAAERFRTATRGLAAALEADDRPAVARQIRAIWDACESCHADFTG